MALESRSKMVSIRVTSEEYNRFRQFCRARGVPNVSEMLRTAANQLVGSSSSETPVPINLAARLTDLEARFDTLILTVESLGQTLSALPAVAGGSRQSVQP